MIHSFRSRSVLRARRLFPPLVAALVMSGCLSSPRPDPAGSAPPMPVDANPITQITWAEAVLPDGIGPESMFYGAVGGPKGFVIVGDTGALGFGGLALRSIDGRTWELVDDHDIAPWSLETVIATDSGFIALGGNFGAGETGWSSAILTSTDGREWSVSHQSETSILSIAAHGSLVVAISEGPTILVSDDTGASWTAVERSAIENGAGVIASGGVVWGATAGFAISVGAGAEFRGVVITSMPGTGWVAEFLWARDEAGAIG